MTLAAVLVVGCRQKPAPQAAASPVGSPNPAELACPEGTVRRGLPPPEGRRVWCETTGGVSHGPFVAWHDDGAKKAEGWFDRGEAHGQWTTWYASGVLRSGGRYEHGKRVGAWKEADERDDVATYANSSIAVRFDVRECDEFVHKYLRCIDTMAPESAKYDLLEQMKKTIETWEPAPTPKERQRLQQRCGRSLRAAKETAEGWGCRW